MSDSDTITEAQTDTAITDNETLVRRPAWQPLGMQADKISIPSELAEIAKLTGWNVRTEDITKRLVDLRWDKGRLLGLVRDSPMDGKTDLLTTVTERYDIVPNETVAEFADAVCTRARAKVDSAGSYEGGRIVYLAIEMPDSFVVDPGGANDEVKNYLLLINSFNKTWPFSGLTIPVRASCANTLNFDIPGHLQQFKIDVDKNGDISRQTVDRLLQANDNYMTQFAREAEELFQTTVTDMQFWELLQSVYKRPTGEKRGGETRWANKAAEVMSTWHEPANASIKFTGWGALNAFIEQAQWGRGSRGDSRQGFYTAGAGLEPKVNKARTDMYQQIREFLIK